MVQPSSPTRPKKRKLTSAGAPGLPPPVAQPPPVPAKRHRSSSDVMPVTITPAAVPQHHYSAFHRPQDTGSLCNFPQQVSSQTFSSAMSDIPDSCRSNSPHDNERQLCSTPVTSVSRQGNYAVVNNPNIVPVYRQSSDIPRSVPDITYTVQALLPTIR